MKIKAPDLVKAYYETIKDKFPHLSFEQIREACNFEFKFVKQNIKSGVLPRIRLKYLGVYQVKKNTALWGLHQNEEMNQKNMVIPEKYEQRKQMITTYLERYEKTKRKSSIKSRNQ